MIKSWPTVLWYLPQEQAQFPVFRLVGFQLRDTFTADGKRFGETVWVTDGLGAPAGLAWEWAEERPGVLLLADPNTMVSNIRFVCPQGQQESALRALISMNRLAHHLNWQRAVCDALQDKAQVTARLGKAHGTGSLLAAPRSTQDRRRQSGQRTAA